MPAHNEDASLSVCLDALRTARALSPVPVRLVVVLDACSDSTAEVVGGGVRCITTDVANVGAARALGFRSDTSTAGSSTWYVSTDADSLVDPGHFRSIVASAAHTHVLPGPIRIEDGHRDPAVLRRFRREYADRERRGLLQVHGANLAVRADAYRAVGGFRALAVHEDVDLVERLGRRGYRIRRAGAPCVTTSARSSTRTTGGFATFLDEMATPATA
ncbi:glycosyltransferase [Rhodococcus sp. BP-349]|uniref:glycosyltransferase n=1 Tax=unclassified Rhodococcus (in: high G+C Gram-positive bacteria) TaxID=192944 RepID=UPI001C9BB064|nr:MULTISPECIES: glycosyltransferase [unclassified Rhodococcus (in: high G+C Gram-positive bacteria)]MBY6593914.1 glycosyltransferase [Rhodococcus sp. BP-359]MBY6619940.1 glycosyltransferase [Rhodococcus sp. BP-357]MBY6538056.1 glycosyltransferase [Rhodococcus sp. BP-363]MBY6542393.1 glycosyltransferase [Rhodococcus sp. BP-369]MBY6561623.1 glycosyltransferase [Rhodococcus sp. BP-370]